MVDRYRDLSTEPECILIRVFRSDNAQMEGAYVKNRECSMEEEFSLPPDLESWLILLERSRFRIVSLA